LIQAKGKELSEENETKPEETTIDWHSKFEAQQKVNRDLEAKLKNLYSVNDEKKILEEKVAKFEGKEKEFEQESVAREANAKALETANQRILKAEIRAASAGKLSDPNDALRFIDTSDFTVSDEGDVDRDTISSAIDDLLRNKPYLSAQGGEPTGVKFMPPSGMRDEEEHGQLSKDQAESLSQQEMLKAYSDGRLNDAIGRK
jgi:hypothetical protein